MILSFHVVVAVCGVCRPMCVAETKMVVKLQQIVKHSCEQVNLV